MGKDLFNDRISRFSIRKLNVGVCSVLLGTLVMVGVANQVSADETSNQTQVEDVTNTTAVASEGTQSQNTVATQASMEVANILSSSEANSQSQAVSTASQIVSEASTTPASSEAISQAAVSTSETSASSVQSSNSVAGTVNVASSTTGASTTASSLAATSESQASASASEAKNLNVEVEASSGNSLSGGVESPVVEQPVVTAETSGKRRSRRSIGDPNDPNLIADDVQDATSTPKEAKPGFTTNIKATDLASQISWLDFGDVANWTGTTTTSSGNLALQVGSAYTKEIMPGYVVTIKVKSLKPFQATEIYKKRLEDRGATAAEKATYDPNARNGYVNGATTNNTKAAFSAGEEAKVVAEAQTRWSEIKGEGINTGAKKTTISSEFDGGNIGVQFEISATFRGKVVKPAIVMADGESANPGELLMFTTNGEGWQQIGEWYKYGNKATKTFIPQDTDNLFGSNPSTNINGMSLYRTNLDQLRRSNQVGPDKKAVAWKYFGSSDLTTGGLGTGVFGPNISASSVAVPLVMTKGASEIGLYIVSGGKQSAMFGFFPLDEGDAPESYGKAIHSIATVDGITGNKVTQPYLGHLSPDMDENNAHDWFGDDNATTADEGVDQLLPADLKGTTNEMIKMDRTHPGNYTITLEAHTDGAPQANIYGWIDFNQNGTFDEDERSDLATITKDGSVTLRFTKSKTYIDPSVNELGVRVRIAKDADQIEKPTGMAFSGEVEDFRTQVTHPPKGEVKATSGLQGEKQTATVAFTARGLYKYSRTAVAQIDETVAPQIVDNRTGQVVTPGADGYYAVAGQGKYKITPNGTSVDVEFIPEDHFLGTADGISIRRTDTNGYDTGWSTKFPDMEANVDTAINTMDGLYIPTVTPKDIEGESKTSTDVQGATQTGTPTFNVVGTNLDGDKVAITPSALYPAKLVDPATGQPTNALSVTVAGEGTYTIDDTTGKVTFVPEPGFTGSANGVTVTLSAPVGRDKDGTIRDEYVKTATAKYTPTVTPITATPTNKVSADVQNVPQTQTPTFDLSNDKTAQITSKKLVDPTTGQPTDDATVTVAGEGSYTIDPTTGAVTFTPEKDFVGTAKGVTVQATATITNENGKTATITSDATYTPTVVAAVPTAQSAKSKDIQGATQTGTPTFAGTTVQVNGQDKAITIKDNSYKLLDKDGNEVTGTTPAYAADGTTEIGNFSIDPATGTVTFTPTDKSYTGAVTPAKVQAESSNGIKVDTTYTPEIVPVTPTATPAETTDIQGATQKGKPEFQGGTVNVDGVDKTVAINEAVPATFDDGTKTKTIPNVGTYTVAADGTVTFVPEKSFVGTAPAVTVVREDMNGTKASATYTPTVTPVTPTATPAESTGPQGLVQTGTVTFTEGDPVAPINKDSITLLDENGQPAASVDAKSPAGDVIGTYTVDKETGVVTFTPTDKSYSGDVVPAKVRAADTNGTTVETTYTPKITPVVPTAEPTTSTDIQGATQTGKPVFTEGDSRVPMDDTVPATFDDGSTTKTVDGVGTYTVALDGTVTFKPLPTYVGTPEGVTVKRVDKNGTPATATYTPTVTPVTPTATPAETSGVQGATQSGKPVFTEGNSRVPMNDAVPATFDDGSTSKTVDGIGTYTVASDGTVTFVPDPSFTGTAPAVTVVREDKNGTKASATYTPTVNPVTLTPTNKVSEDIQNVPQTETPTFALSDDETAQITSKKLIDPATGQPTDETSVTVAGEGTYTIDPTTGAVTFTPEKDFVGTAKGVTVQATATVTNEAGKTSTITSDASYTPTVVAAVPTAQPATSKDIQGATQTGTPTFAGTTVQVNGQDKTITIKDNSYTLLDKDGNEVSTTPAYAADGTTEIGTYSIDPATGQVTFTPTDKSYTGQVTPVKVQAESSNGIKVDTTYTPEIVPVTPTATPAETTDIQGATQTGKPEFKGGTVTVDGVEKTVEINEDVPATFDDGSTTKTVDGVGTYTVAADGTVTFVPEKSFVGTAPAVMVVREDKNGTKASATYTPTVTPVTPTATPVETTDIQGATQTGKPVFTEGDSRVPMNDDVPATFDDGSTTKTVDGVGTYTVAADGTVTFVPEKTFTGTAPAVTVVREDKNGTKASATYTPTVTPVTPTATPVETTGKQGQTQTGKPEFTEGDSRVPMNDDVPATFDDGLTTKTVDGVGTYTVAADGTVTFVPEKSFIGKAPAVTVVREDKNGTKASATYTPTVTPVTPTATPAESTGPQGLVQTGTVTFTEGDEVAPINKDSITLLDENGQPAASVEAKSPAGDVIGTYTVDKDTGVVTFTPTDKSYSGDVVPVKVQAADANGTTVETTYTPKITPVVPTSEDATSTDIQGQTQSGKPTFTEGNPNVPIDEDTPATFEDGSITKTIPGEGTYTVSPDGTVTFVPEKSFTGTGTGVTVKRVDKNGTEITAKYTPTVTPVTPTAEPATSTDIQGATQTGKPEFTEGDSRVPMNDDVPATFEDGSTTRTVDGVGTYTVAADGTVTFVPEKSFVGTAPAVTVVREDKNGTKASATYTPSVTPVTPTAEGTTSTDKQGQTQSGTPTFTPGNPNVPMDDDTPATFEDGSTTKTIPGEGTYTVAPDGTVTFVPEKSFTGEGTGVTVKRVDKNGTSVTAKYTPTVTPVTPTATPAESTGPQGIVQTGTVAFTEGDPVAPIDKDTITLLDDNGQPAASVDAKSPAGDVIGTFTVNKETGVVTFTPTDKSYSGDVVPVKVQGKDTNGTVAETTYTPKITPVVPTADPATSTDIQGQTQTGKPSFTPGNPSVPMDDDVPATFEDGSTTKVIPGEGTYTVAPDGTVTFVPEKSFTGTGTGVTVKRVDKNGSPVTATYTPTVTPVTPTATPAESTGPQGATQTGKPEFTEGDSRVPMNDDVPATFEDGSTTKTVEGVGTYTVAADGTVTFVPEKSFVGTAPAVTVVREDKNGTKASATYTPTVTPVIPTAKDTTSTGPQGATQTGKPEFTEGDSRVPMNDDVPATFEDGSTTKTIPGEGTYTVAPDGTVTFVPEKSFTGTGTGVTVKRVDKNGTPVTATYTPTVTPVTPTATPAESTGPQGVVQTGTVTFTEGDPAAPIDKDTITLLDENGQPAASVIAKSPEGKEIGTYTVDKTTGVVTFTPTDKSYSGEVVPVKVQAADANGTVAETTYTPKITPVVPTADPATSTGIQGQTQSGKPSFTPGNPAIPMDDDVPATFEDGSTTKTIPGEGTYTVAPDGTVTFVPEKSFTGTGTGVTVKRVDKNGTPVTATYTPTVTPVTPTAESTTSIGNKGQTQTGKPVFTEGDSRVPMNDKVPATFDDGSTTKTIPGVGTYTVAADGTVTFTPEAEFTGTAPAVTVVREDVNGTKASATYTPTVRPITKFVDKEGKEIPGYSALDGEQPKAEISGYRFVETKKLPNGDFEHVYEKVTTSYVDENGTPIPGYPTEEGQQPKKDIPGYEFVKTVVDENGNTQHIYKKTVTPTPVPDSTPTPEPQPTPQAKQEESVLPETKEEASFINPTDENAQLPKTGSEDSNLAIFGLASLLAGFGLYGTKRRKR
ncbi:GEVED domain-containing protein [uncultured Streptococcus sp.]|uniref:GEVED domain-containing protein n=1 Tax=uncultured Streptococcus sp. TaxID=83427 RepID=UPI002618EB85|nr:GEVED domain-containing protein [uncultured Streptococcus sp.]